MSFKMLAAIVRADFLLRIRRTSTLVIILLLCISAYLWIPDPSTGRALLQFNEQRALYNSAALSFATATLCTSILSLIGFYMLSNSLRRDIQTRMGFIIASTTVRNSEFLFGKFLGNAAFLTAVVAAFMLSSMVMQLVRGEGPLEPLVYVRQYAILIPPMVSFVSAAAIFFESTRFLSGRIGDLLYFFLWGSLLSLAAVMIEGGADRWLALFDTTGIGYLVSGARTVMHSDSVSLGSSPFDATKPPIVIDGFPLSRTALLARVVAALYPLLIVAAALPFFHRFDPTKLKLSSRHARRGLIALLNRWSKPLTRPMERIVRALGSRPNQLGAILADALLTIQANPMTLFLYAGFAIAFLSAPAGEIKSGLLPWALAAMALMISDISTRDATAGTGALIASAVLPGPRYMLWKVFSGFAAAAPLLVVPCVRLLFVDPAAVPYVAAGAIFIVAAATASGTMSGNPKTFVGPFLLFWYVSQSGGADTPALDFAGCYGRATPATGISYVAVGALLLAAAELIHRRRAGRHQTLRLWRRLRPAPAPPERA